jgi:hypothetical protein
VSHTRSYFVQVRCQKYWIRKRQRHLEISLDTFANRDVLHVILENQEQEYSERKIADAKRAAIRAAKADAAKIEAAARAAKGKAASKKATEKDPQENEEPCLEYLGRVIRGTSH